LFIRKLLTKKFINQFVSVLKDVTCWYVWSKICFACQVENPTVVKPYNYRSRLPYKKEKMEWTSLRTENRCDLLKFIKFEKYIKRHDSVSAPSYAPRPQCLFYAKRRIDRSFDYRISI